MPSSEQLGRDYQRLSSTVFSHAKTGTLDVLVVGAGALGNEIIKNLCLVGVRSIFIVDCDVVESSNLTRSVLFSIPDINSHIEARTPKALLAAKRIAEMNPEVATGYFVGEIADFGLGRLMDFDLVFSAVDNEMARLELSWACTTTDRLLVDGGLGLHNYSSGMVSIFPGGNGPCYACRKGKGRRAMLLSEFDGLELPCAQREQQATQRGEIPTTPVMASIIAAIQVEVGIREALAERKADNGRSIEIRLHPEQRLLAFDYSRNPDCPLHVAPLAVYLWHETSSSMTTIETLSAHLENLGYTNTSLVLRWPIVSVAACKACGRQWSPMQRISSFKRKTSCACGSDSVQALELLREVGADSPWLTRTIRDLGLPDSHIHEFVCDDNDGPVVVQMTN